MDDWHGTATIMVAGVDGGSWRLPRRADATMGRAGSSGIRLVNSWVPNRLATLQPERFGWLLENGHSTRLSVTGPGVRGARFEPGGLVALGRGSWQLAWELDSPLHAAIGVRTKPPAADLPWALSRKVPVDDPRQLTAYAAHETRFSPAELHLLAVLFEHEFDAEPAPRNLCEAAALRLGLRTADVKNRANTVRRRVNQKRPAKHIETLEELGFYLVHTARAVTPTDLDP